MIDFTTLGGSNPPLASGRFRIELQAGSWSAYSNAAGTGVAFAVKIAEPADQAGRDVRLQLMLKAVKATVERIAERDRAALAAWAKGVGATGGKDVGAAMLDLWKASRGRRVWAELSIHKDSRGLTDIALVDVSVEPLPRQDGEACDDVV